MLLITPCLWRGPFSVGHIQQLLRLTSQGLAEFGAGLKTAGVECVALAPNSSCSSAERGLRCLSTAEAASPAALQWPVQKNWAAPFFLYGRSSQGKHRLPSSALATQGPRVCLRGRLCSHLPLWFLLPSARVAICQVTWWLLRAKAFLVPTRLTGAVISTYRMLSNIRKDPVPSVITSTL